MSLGTEFIELNKIIHDRGSFDCGENDSIVLDFDHVYGKKKYNISDMVKMAVSINHIKKEIKKCEIRCANCHRRKHFRDVVRSGNTYALGT